MNDKSLLLSSIYVSLMALIILMHLAAALVRAYKNGKGCIIIAAINTLVHLGLCFYMLASRAGADELLLTLLISLAANIASTSIKRKEGKKDGI